MWFWYAWVIVFIIAEIVGLLSDSFPTLSVTWRHTVESLPPAAAVTVYAVTGALFFWLLTVHWLWFAFDQKGFDIVEITAVVTGLFIGLSAFVSTRRKRKSEEEEV